MMMRIINILIQMFQRRMEWMKEQMVPFFSCLCKCSELFLALSIIYIKVEERGGWNIEISNNRHLNLIITISYLF